MKTLMNINELVKIYGKGTIQVVFYISAIKDFAPVYGIEERHCCAHVLADLLLAKEPIDDSFTSRFLKLDGGK